MKQETLQLTGGAGKDKRRELDFYPTPKNVTVALMKFLNLPPRVIWEPACGNLAMSNVLSEFGHTVVSTDIQFGDNFFDTVKDCQAIITNPPFNESEAFIRRSLSFENVRLVVMLLKSQYWHGKGRLKLFEEHTPSYVLPLTWRPDFLEHLKVPGKKKGAPTMEVCWSVWQKGASHQTIYKPLSRP